MKWCGGGASREWKGAQGQVPLLPFQGVSCKCNQAGRGGAGYVNARAMVKAQLERAGKHGAHIILEMAVEIEAINDDVVVTTDGGKVISAMKVLLCTIAYTNNFFF